MKVSHLFFLRVAPAHRAKRSSGLEVLRQARQFVELRAAFAMLFAQAVEPFFDHNHVRQHQLGVEIAQLLERVRRRSVSTWKGANHQAESVRITQRLGRIGVEARALAAGSRQIDEAHLGIGFFPGPVEVRKGVHSRVGNLDRAEVGVAVGRGAFSVHASQCIEERCFANQCVAHQSCFHPRPRFLPSQSAASAL